MPPDLRLVRLLVLILVLLGQACEGVDEPLHSDSDPADADATSDSQLDSAEPNADAATDTAETPDSVVLPDLGPMELPSTCDPVELPMADTSVCDSLRPDRLPPALPDKLWVRGESIIAIGRFYDADHDLITLNGPELRLDDIRSAWGCEQEWWAGGERGRVIRRKDESFDRYQLPRSFDVLAGRGCGADVTVAGDGVWRFDRESDAWQLWVDTVVWENPDPMDKAVDEIIDIAQVGIWTVALGNYGDAYIHNTFRDEWRYHGRTDDLNSDVFLRSDGRGFTLHYGYGLFLDANVDSIEEGHRGLEINDVHQVERVSDSAYWLAGRYNTDGEALRYVSGDQCTRFPNIPQQDFPSINLGDITRDGERLWFVARLFDPDSSRLTFGLYTLHPEEGWCAFFADPQN